MDQWIESLSPKQWLALVIAGIFIISGCDSIIVLLASYSAWQAALAGLGCICALFLICLVRVAIHVVRLLQS